MTMSAPVLQTRRITAPGATPSRWILMLHGIFGRGRNWSAVATALCAARPDVGAELVDLRLHGGSRGFAPPHDLDAAAGDVEALLHDAERPVVAILGHSFGGKVAMALAARNPAGVRQTWVIDASPSKNAPEGNTWKLTRLLRALPARFPSRDDAVRGIVAGGLDETTARWMATNLVSDGSDYVWGFDLDAIESLLRDYFARDLWPVIETRGRAEIILVKATESVALSDADEARLVRAAAADAGVTLVRMKGGHWIHAEDPAGVVRLLAEKLPRDGSARG